MIKLNLNIPDEFYNEEIRCDYTISAEMKKVWAVELDLLAELDRVCRKYNIKYCADGGTLLGAVRHKGFIPWDDDLDIAMLRSDYERLNKIAPTEFKTPYFWQTEETDPGSARGHAQLRNSDTTGILQAEYDNLRNNNYNQGIFIDIFPFDTVTDNPDALRIQDQRRLYLRREYSKVLYTSQYYHFNPTKDSNGKYHLGIKTLIRHVFNMKDYREPYYAFIDEITKYNRNTDSKYVADLCMPLPLKRLERYRDDFYVLRYTRFEFMQIPIFSNYDRNLKILYGDDYMIPLQASSEHGNVIFDVDKPYTWYLKQRK